MVIKHVPLEYVNERGTHTPMIEVENLVKRYGQFTAVNGITFTAQPGQVTGFLGPNGAGKTTTMRMLTGYLPPSDGAAKVAGYDIFDQSMQVRERVGYLPENVPLYRDMTAGAYLRYIAEIRGVKNRSVRADEALDRVGLLDRKRSQIRNLSKGMRQRVGLASVLMHNPDVIILDEPTIGLDPLQVEELRNLIRELGQDHTVMFSTHILSEAEQVCDKVVIVNRGEVVAEGAPSELRSSLETGGRILVRVDGAESDLETVRLTLERMEIITHAEVRADALVVTPSDPTVDPRPDIARAVIQHGWDLMELRALAADLEEIFLEVTRQERRAAQSDVTPEATNEQPANDAEATDETEAE
jgi:ABC-2 type transport system ATP-binding protein